MERSLQVPTVEPVTIRTPERLQAVPGELRTGKSQALYRSAHNKRPMPTSLDHLTARSPIPKLEAELKRDVSIPTPYLTSGSEQEDL